MHIKNIGIVALSEKINLLATLKKTETASAIFRRNEENLFLSKREQILCQAAKNWVSFKILRSEKLFMASER